MSEDDRAGLAYVCARLAYVEKVLTEDGETAPLRDLIVAARTGGDLEEPLAALHTGLQRAGDSLGVWGTSVRGSGAGR